MLYVMRFDVNKGCGDEFMSFAKEAEDFWNSIEGVTSIQLYYKGIGAAQSRTVLIGIESLSTLDKAFTHPQFESIKRQFRRITENFESSVIIELPFS